MIMHLDMDAFFASVEQMDDPALRGRPLVIGGGDRGVVATASYEARKYGIHSAMPIARARELCPHAIFMRGRGWRYSEISRKIMSTLREFSPVVQAASIDEAYLDVNGLKKIFGSPETLAETVKKRVSEASGGLTCSIGMAPVKFLAKICSDQRKPDGIFILHPEDMDAFLLSLEVEKLPGVGKAMSRSLRAFGICTVASLRGLGRKFLVERYGKYGQVLHDRARGIDPRPVTPNAPAKSESAECTFSADISDKSQLLQILRRHAERVGRSLRKNGLAGRTITLKIKYNDFKQITRTRSLETRTCSTETIFEAAKAILYGVRLAKPVRLIGVGVSGFDERPEFLSLPGLPEKYANPASHALHGDPCLVVTPDPEIENRRRRLDRALDLIRRRFGRDIILRGASQDIAVESAAHHSSRKEN